MCFPKLKGLHVGITLQIRAPLQILLASWSDRPSPVVPLVTRATAAVTEEQPHEEHGQTNRASQAERPFRSSSSRPRHGRHRHGGCIRRAGSLWHCTFREVCSCKRLAANKTPNGRHVGGLRFDVPP